jgi:hypothetical protein
LKTRVSNYAGTALIAIGIFLFLLFAIINPMTLKRDTSSCTPQSGYGTATCGMLYGGILLMFFYQNSLVFEILSLLVAAFGIAIVAIDKIKVRQSSIER